MNKKKKEEIGVGERMSRRGKRNPEGSGSRPGRGLYFRHPTFPLMQDKEKQSFSTGHFDRPVIYNFIISRRNSIFILLINQTIIK